jgi:hypothetical protein
MTQEKNNVSAVVVSNTTSVALPDGDEVELHILQNTIVMSEEEYWAQEEKEYWRQVASELTDEDFELPDLQKDEVVRNQMSRACGKTPTLSPRLIAQNRRETTIRQYRNHRAIFAVRALRPHCGQGRSRAPALRRRSPARSSSRVASTDDGDGSGPPQTLTCRSSAGVSTDGIPAATDTLICSPLSYTKELISSDKRVGCDHRHLFHALDNALTSVGEERGRP